MADLLPEFAKPPVSEVALSVTFAPLENWRSAHAGMYWGKVIDRYPLTEVQPPLPYQIETFEGTVRPAPQTIQFELSNPDAQRYWFLTDPAIRLVQVQRDHFVINWRKIKGDEPYPRYMGDLRPRFEKEWQMFVAFLAEHKIGEPTVQQCEVTYVNDIVRGEGWDNGADATTLFAPWWAKGSNGFLPPPEAINIGGSFLMPEKRGRLHFSAARAFRVQDGMEAIKLQLIARGNPASGKVADILSWMDCGHEWIVRGFTDLTSPRAHELWERKQ